MTFPSPPTRRGGAPVRQSTALFRWEARSLSLTATTGQVGALVRAAGGTAIDSAGVTYTAGHSSPRWEARTWDTESRLGLRMAADDLAWPVLFTPRTATIVVEMRELGTRVTSGAGLLYIGNDAQSGARWTIDSNGTNYRATVHNGTTSVSATLASATPNAETARLTMQVEDDGSAWRVRLHNEIAAGTEVTAWSSTIARAATFGTTTRLRLNRVGSAGTQGSTWVSLVAVVSGTRTPTDVVDDV